MALALSLEVLVELLLALLLLVLAGLGLFVELLLWVVEEDTELVELKLLVEEATELGDELFPPSPITGEDNGGVVVVVLFMAVYTCLVSYLQKQ
jgi:hypothetical protein